VWRASLVPRPIPALREGRIDLEIGAIDYVDPETRVVHTPPPETAGLPASSRNASRRARLTAPARMGPGR
jgi:hypothetical protein